MLYLLLIYVSTDLLIENYVAIAHRSIIVKLIITQNNTNKIFPNNPTLNQLLKHNRITLLSIREDKINYLKYYNVLLQISKMITESLWKREQSILEEEASNISVLKKQITKEAEIDASVQLSIGEKIQNLKQNATIIAKKLQNEKHKNSQLETIIKYMKNKMEQQRLQEASFRDNINSESLTSLDGKFKKLEYDLGQINSKVNRLFENVEDKRNKISQNRTERVIDSGIFRNIQKQLIDSDLTFKKLLIEKIKYQKDYQKLIEQYKILKEKAEMFAQKDSSKAKNSIQSSNIPSNLQSTVGDYKKKFLELQASKYNRDRIPTTLKFDQQIDMQQEKHIVCIQKMLSETRLDTSSELVNLFQNIDDINEKSFNQMNNYIDSINQIDRYLAAAATIKKQKALKFYPQKKQISKQEIVSNECKQMKKKLLKQNQDIMKQIQQFNTLFESPNFKKFLSQLNIQVPTIKQGDYVNFDVLTLTLQLLQKNIQQFICQSNTINLQKNNHEKIQGNADKLQQMINKVKRNEQCLKVMKKQQFQEEYHRIAKNVSQKSVGPRIAKKKSIGFIKR